MSSDPELDYETSFALARLDGRIRPRPDNRTFPWEVAMWPSESSHDAWLWWAAKTPRKSVDMLRFAKRRERPVYRLGKSSYAYVWYTQHWQCIRIKNLDTEHLHRILEMFRVAGLRAHPYIVAEYASRQSNKVR